MDNISERIKLLRKQKKISQLEMAEKIGLQHQSNYARFENRGKKLSFEELEKIAGALEVSVKYLLFEEETTNSDIDKIKILEEQNDLLKRELDLAKREIKLYRDEKALELKQKYIEEKNKIFTRILQKEEYQDFFNQYKDKTLLPEEVEIITQNPIWQRIEVEAEKDYQKLIIEFEENLKKIYFL